MLSMKPRDKPLRPGRGGTRRSTLLFHRIAKAEAQEPHPGQPVAQVELGALVAEVVLGLQDQHLEHQDVVERRPAALGAIRPWHGALELGPEQLEVDHGREPKPAGRPILILPAARHSRADQARLAQVFGGLQLT
jgi:hypothetical protein